MWLFAACLSTSVECGGFLFFAQYYSYLASDNIILTLNGAYALKFYFIYARCLCVYVHMPVCCVPVHTQRTKEGVDALELQLQTLAR